MSALVLLAYLLVRFRSLVVLLIVAGIVSFLMLPVIRLLVHRARFSWSTATHISFLFLLLLLMLLSTATGLAVIQQLQALFLTLQRVLIRLPETLRDLSEQRFALGPLVLDLAEFDFAPLLEQALGYVQPALRQASGLIAGLATIALEGVAKMLFVIAVAYFFSLDHARIVKAWENLSLPGYEGDMARLRMALGNIWNAFLRGQLLIVLVTGLLTWALTTVMGVRFSLGLGVLGGVAKFVPILGPTTAGLVAVLVALFQPTNWLGLSPLAHAALVGIAIIVLDQSIDYLLVPRIMGSSLNLHPVIVLVGAILGVTLAGVLGLLLSAPAMASGILIGRYIYRKLTDQSPWNPPIDVQTEASPPAPGRFRIPWKRRDFSRPGLAERDPGGSSPGREGPGRGAESAGRGR